MNKELEELRDIFNYEKDLRIKTEKELKEADEAVEYWQKECDKRSKVLDKIKNNNKRIIDYGFDYDGFNNVEDLKKLIDMLVDYAKQNDELLEEIE